MAPTHISFLYNDVFDTATAAAYSAISTLPVSNLQTALVDQVYRSTDDSTAEYVKFDCAAAVSINTIVLINHNLSTLADNIIIEANATDAWTAPSFTSIENSGSAVASDAMAADNTADWTDEGANISLAFDTDHYEVTTDAATQECWLANKSVTANYLYEMRIKLKNGTASAKNIKFYMDDGAAQYSGSLLSTADETEHIWQFRAANTSAVTKLGIQVVESLAGDNLELDDFTVYRVTSESAWESGETDSGTKTITRVFFLSATQSYRYWRIRIMDTTADGYIQIGRIMAGTYIEAAKNFQYGWSQTLVDGSSKKRIGTVTYVDRRYKWNRIECGMQIATDSEKQDTFLVMLNTIGIAEDFVLMLNPGTASGRNDLSFYGQLADSPQFTNDFTTYHKARFVFEESVGDNSELPVLTYARGVFGGGSDDDLKNVIDYITIATAGNATDFNDLSSARFALAACASSTRGIFGGGFIAAVSNILDYITIATASIAIDYGDLTVARQYLAACSSSTRGVFGGGDTGSNSNVIDYITIVTAGNATDFNDLTAARKGVASCASSTRGVFGGGYIAANVNTIDYITIATLSAATDFNDLTVARSSLAACASSTRGIFGGGDTGSNSDVIDYITIATASAAIDFGNLTVARSPLAACSSSTRGVFGGGSGVGYSDVLDYIAISILSNATDFGNLTDDRYGLAACANKGGL